MYGIVIHLITGIVKVFNSASAGVVCVICLIDCIDFGFRFCLFFCLFYPSLHLPLTNPPPLSLSTCLSLTLPHSLSLHLPLTNPPSLSLTLDTTSTPQIRNAYFLPSTVKLGHSAFPFTFSDWLVTHTHTHTHTYVRMHTHTHTHMFACTRTHTHTCTHVKALGIHSTHTHTHMFACTYIHI